MNSITKNNIFCLQEESLKEKLKLGLVFILLFIHIIGIIFLSVFIVKRQYTLDFALFCLFVGIVLVLFGIIATIRYLKKNYEHKILKIVFTWILIIITLFFTVYFVDIKSGDYKFFLDIWCESYSKLSLKDCLVQITNISNYTPIYNYYLIFVAKSGFNYLYAIKFLTFLFSLFMSITMELIISHLKNKSFNFLDVLIFMVIPAVLVEYSIWGQCDAIYVTFCLLAFYFALKKKSKLSFMFIGLAFATKLQFLFIVPILFLMLIFKDENGEHYLKWKHIWIAPLMYAVNLIPALVGANILDLLLVFFNQSSEYNYVSMNCPNVAYILQYNFGKGNYYVSLSIILLAVTIVFLLIILIFVLKRNKIKPYSKIDYVKIEFLFSFVMVLFMPKMHERFFFLSNCLIWVVLILVPTKTNFILTLLHGLAVYASMITYLLGIDITILSSFMNLIVLIVIFIDFARDIKQVCLKSKSHEQSFNINQTVIKV